MSITDDAPPQTPSLSPKFGIGFRQPVSPPSSPRLPSPSSSPEDAPTTDGPDWASGTDDESSEWDESPAPTPSTESSPESEAVKVELLTEEEMQAWARGGVAFASEKAHEAFAVTPGQLAVDLYRTTEKEQASIGDPIGSIASRRQGIGGKVSPDTKDLLSLLTGLAAYGTRQINLRSQARAIDAGAAPQEAVDL